MRISIYAGLAATCLALGAPAVSAATFNLTPVADGQVQNTSGPVIATSTGTDLTAGRGAGNVNTVGVFEFDLSAIADTATIASAVFGFTLGTFVTTSSNIANPVVEFTVDAYLGNGVVDVADFSAAGTEVVNASLAARLPGTPVIAATDTGTTHSFALSSFVPVQDALAGDKLTLRLSVTNFPEQLRIAMLENTTWAAATLTLEATPYTPPPSAVPLPAGLPLLLGGLGALGLVRRKRT